MAFKRVMFKLFSQYFYVRNIIILLVYSYLLLIFFDKKCSENINPKIVVENTQKNELFEKLQGLIKENDRLIQDNDVLMRSKNLVIEPSLKYEKSRRHLFKSVKSFWENFVLKLSDLKQINPGISKDLNILYEMTRSYKISCISNLEQLSRNDGYDTWRLKESADLRRKIQRKFDELQNPLDCNKAKILKCYPYTNPEGWGSTLHRIAECKIIAHALGRTMIFDSTGFSYNKTVGFSGILQPFSKTCAKTPTEELELLWPNNHTNRILALTKEIIRKPYNTSAKIPADLARRLHKLSDEPLGWWIGQIVDFSVKYTPNIQKLLRKFEEMFKNKHPIVGVHIRRTDKLAKVRFQSVENYMRHVEEYYDQLELTKPIKKRRVFLATEDPEVIKEVKEKYSHYEILTNEEAAKLSKSLENRWTTKALLGIIVDMHLLSLTDYVVCTLSSNVCVLMQEDFQVKFPDTTNKLVSLDSMYFADFRIQWPAKVLMDHFPLSDKEIKLNAGEPVTVYRYRNGNGYYHVKPYNRHRIGNVPSYKIDLVYDTMDTPPF